MVTAFTVAHSITLISAAYGLVPAGEWFPPLVEALIAASIIYMAAENIIGANLPRRWLATAIFGLVHGFGFSFALAEELQFAGAHLVLSLLAFNVGIEIGQVLVLAAALPILAWFARPTPVISVAVALVAAYWMVERAAALPLGTDVLMAAARVLSVALVLVGLACWIVGRRLKP